MRPSIKPSPVVTTQNSKLLPLLFEGIDEEMPVTVLHVGPALSDTIDFFCEYRCKLHFVDLFAELPMVETEEGPRFAEQMESLLDFPADTVFDLCLFWDIFNYLNRDAILAMVKVLRDHLRPGTLAHMFSMHNTRIESESHLYGIRSLDTVSCRELTQQPEGYAPHSQRKLKDLLYCFNLERSVLLPDSRLEVLLNGKP